LQLGVWGLLRSPGGYGRSPTAKPFPGVIHAKNLAPGELLSWQFRCNIKTWIHEILLLFVNCLPLQTRKLNLIAVFMKQGRGPINCDLSQSINPSVVRSLLNWLLQLTTVAFSIAYTSAKVQRFPVIQTARIQNQTPSIIPQQEARLILTNRATRLEVSQGHQIWYHSID